MQVKVIAICSFPYKYKSRQVYLASGETMYLDDRQDMEEIKYLLSDSFPYREFIYVEGNKGLARNPTRVNEDLHLVPMLPLYDPYPHQKPYTTPPLDAEENPHVLETLEAAGVVLPPDDSGSVSQPTKGITPSENPAIAIPIVNTQLGKVGPLDITEIIERPPASDLPKAPIKSKLVEMTPLPSPPPSAPPSPPPPPVPQKGISLTPLKEVKEVIDAELVSDKDKRVNELKHMSLFKLKEVAKTYQIEFTNKAEVIAKILSLEFQDG